MISRMWSRTTVWCASAKHSQIYRRPFTVWGWCCIN